MFSTKLDFSQYMLQLIHLRILSNAAFREFGRIRRSNDGVKSCFTHPYYVALISGGLVFELLFHKAHWKWARKNIQVQDFFFWG